MKEEEGKNGKKGGEKEKRMTERKGEVRGEDEDV